ncbi:M20/M25/M40 family metallo-hydrolase [Methanocorpusculum vombati]|uniref:M20/M25/M40 family metallo-hydrolase n=1 Tax=Methanocorpusculum vombati TaxID=3002864 RepID=A0ABT4IM56_9EURY|nr:M20/M25/M40 family metallo-hydrolase [Methanocorpusculum vombati]MCZ9319720.1 M20/M25/M40 family metallo-hydrolase [Methanocorpusculum sp.]MCZ0862826.1 M20/M25/M40 family metallo-hydrolase [Methanocorpusculum vombati]MDE2520740.1 M20/M25/M40 family metallo-hydrolase [Methanocorpusculum sp.]MDE2533754.1 M20/M25/M40 family metallo-hydrolase [Methanocorpusculum sp.]MDE2546642.1 M20/M25/M40 family metallo-hydrolase [Methanocorpusculum sp.]
MDVVRICSELVKIKSENPPGDTTEVAQYIASLLEGLGIRSDITEGSPGHCNVISREQNRALMLSGHMDVVPAMEEGWDIPPYAGVVDDTYVHGRGSTDMKGGCAVILTAVERAMDDCGEIPVSLAFVCDEEGGGRYGTRYLIEKQLIHPCDALIAEPTPAFAPSVGQKGICRFEVEFTGTPGHSSLFPVVGESAIMQAFSFLAWVDVLHNRVYPQSPALEELIEHSIAISDMQEEREGHELSPIFRQIMYNPGLISGGERVNIVAQKCRLTMDLRLPWGCDCDDILREIYGQLPSSAKVTPLTKANASLTDPESFLVQSTANAISSVYHVASKPMVQWAASDARALRKAGFRAIEYGPGELCGLHGLNERVRIDQLRSVEEIYYRLINTYREKYGF